MPQPTPSKVPGAKPNLVPQPLAVPTKQPQPTPSKVPGAKPNLVPQPLAVPYKTPQPKPQQTQYLQPMLVPLLPTTPNQTTSPQSPNGNVVHLVSNTHSQAITSPAITGLTYLEKTVEPQAGLDSKPSNDNQGFILTTLGINTPEERYTFIERPVAQSGNFVFFFDFNSSHIHDDQRPMFDNIVETYENRASPIVVVGETDGFGSEKYNRTIAHHRSSIIVKELIKRGIKEDHIELRLFVRCCKTEPVNAQSVWASRGDRITWVHFE